MKIFKIKLHLLSVFILLSSFIGTSNCSTVIDLELCSDCLRVVTFDTKRQQLLHYETLPLLTTKRSLGSFFTKLHVPVQGLKEMSYSLQLGVDGCFELGQTINVLSLINRDPESIMIMCSGQIKVAGANVGVFDQYLKRYCWANMPVIEKTPNEISQLVPAIKSERAEDFTITRFDKPNMTQLRSMGSANKGQLGELLTRITMFTFGYTGLPSIYEGNSGLDGIFESISKTYLFLTQSKAGDSNPRAPTVMKKELNEPHIHQRLMLMKTRGSTEVVQSQALVMRYLKEKSDQIYKLSHCLLDKGIAQVFVEKLDVQKMPKEGMELFGAPDHEKIQAVQTTLNAFGSNPLEQTALALASLPIKEVPVEDFMTMSLGLYNIDEETQAQILKLLIAKKSITSLVSGLK